MKAAIVVKPNSILCQSVDMPKVSTGQVLIKVAYCGICGSDVPRVLMGKARSYPIVLGHEFSGIIEEVGEGVDSSIVGKPVAGIPLVPCMQCEDCLEGNYSLCKNYTFIGSSLPGAFAEYIVVPAGNAYILPEGIGLKDGCFFEPATVAAHAINMTSFSSGNTAVVVGCGTIGIFLAQLLMYKGAKKVVSLGRRPEKIQVTKAAGIKDVWSTADEGWAEVLMKKENILGFDYVFDCTGNETMMADTFSLANNKGTVCFVGTPKHEMTFSVQQWEWLNRRELTVTGSWMSYSTPWPGEEWDEVAAAFEADGLRVIPGMIDSECRLEDLGAAFEKFNGHNRVSGKMLVNLL